MLHGIVLQSVSRVWRWSYTVMHQYMYICFLYIQLVPHLCLLAAWTFHLQSSRMWKALWLLNNVARETTSSCQVRHNTMSRNGMRWSICMQCQLSGSSSYLVYGGRTGHYKFHTRKSQWLWFHFVSLAEEPDGRWQRTARWCSNETGKAAWRTPPPNGSLVFYVSIQYSIRATGVIKAFSWKVSCSSVS